MKTWKDTLDLILFPIEDTFVVRETRDTPEVMILSRKWYRAMVGEFGNAGRICHEKLGVPENVFDAACVLPFGEAGKQDKRLVDCALVSWTRAELERAKRGWRAAKRKIDKMTGDELHILDFPSLFDVVIVSMSFETEQEMTGHASGTNEQMFGRFVDALRIRLRDDNLPTNQKEYHRELDYMSRRTYIWWWREPSTYKSTALIPANALKAGGVVAITFSGTVIAAQKEISREKDEIENSLSSITGRLSGEKVRHDVVKRELTSAIKDRMLRLGDSTFSATMQQAELEQLCREIRAIVSRNLSSWPRCEPCQQDYEIRTVSEEGIGLGHVCLNTEQKESKVKTKEIPYTFSEDFLRKLKSYGILK